MPRVGSLVVDCKVLEDVRAFQIMSSPAITVSGEARITDAARKMYESNVGSVLVVDDEGKLIGILTRRDLIYLLASGVAVKDPKVSLYMSESVITAKDEDNLKEILDRMSESGVRHVAIVDTIGRPKGVISMWDILMFIARHCITGLQE